MDPIDLARAAEAAEELDRAMTERFGAEYLTRKLDALLAEKETADPHFHARREAARRNARGGTLPW